MARRPAPASASDVTLRLREAITRGSLMPNERLIEADLAGLYRVNRAHVRTALAMLDQEGLVVREKNRGARVRAIADAEALEIAETRLALEALVARQAATRATAAARILDTLKSHLVRLQYRVILLPGRPQSSLAEHRAVVDAICKSDGGAAEAAMRRHLESFTRLLKQAIDTVNRGGI